MMVPITASAKHLAVAGACVGLVSEKPQSESATILVDNTAFGKKLIFRNEEVHNPRENGRVDKQQHGAALANIFDVTAKRSGILNSEISRFVEISA